MNDAKLLPILAHKNYAASSVFTPENLLREGRRQKGLPAIAVPEICILDPDGDVVRHLRLIGSARRDGGWACYHTELFAFCHVGREYGIVGCAVGAAFAVLIAEELFASGCRLLISVTSAGQIAPLLAPPYFMVIDRALRDEGTSYHYLLPETQDAIDAALQAGILAVEMEAAALYAFAKARGRNVLCFAHVTNQLGRVEGDFEKGAADGAKESLHVVSLAAERWCAAETPIGTGI